MTARGALQVHEVVGAADDSRLAFAALAALDGRFAALWPNGVAGRVAFRPDVAAVATLVPLEGGSHATQGLDFGGTTAGADNHLIHESHEPAGSTERIITGIQPEVHPATERAR